MVLGLIVLVCVRVFCACTLFDGWLFVYCAICVSLVAGRIVSVT